ncbi:pannexin 8 [Plakobranchus ocellatus]|uniref:Pannexin 8 n=1 Tax=Plakobranchus ocellatus TaxID=259542 RepID=A0AAV4C7M4_9GAST|nr:pannexin 8 [Plakobranchus ocellatus]
MGVFRRSLAQDSVTYYTYTVSVIFFLILSLVTWLLPLSPDFQPQDQSVEGNLAVKQKKSVEAEIKPRYKAQCWCPVAFAPSMVVYTNAVCGAAFNQAIQGIDPDGDKVGASLYDIAFSEEIPDSEGERDAKKFKPVVNNKTEVEIPTVNVNIPEKDIKKQKDKSEKAWHFIHVKTPFVLFLFAICITIPYVVYTLMSSMMGGVNVDKTLLSAKAARRLDSDSRRQLFSELAHAAAQSMRPCSWVNSALYLLLKLLVCVALLVELFVVNGSLLPRAKSLEDDLKAMPEYAAVNIANNVNEALESSGRMNKEIQDTTYSSKLLLCEMKLRQLANIRSYTIQCVFNPDTYETSRSSSDQDTSPSGVADSHGRGWNFWELYEALYLIVLTYLVLLAVINVISLLEWLVKLVAKPCRERVSCGSDLPVDASLLLYMASENAGPDVVRAFAQSRAWDRGEGKESIALDE